MRIREISLKREQINYTKKLQNVLSYFNSKETNISQNRLIYIIWDIYNIT